ncbi:MAG: hypothetical protein QM731_16755 [Chitinophagaceae bacterium]
MTKHPIIRSVIAGLMLLLFAFSITPKKTLHDWLVDHKDQSSMHVKTGEALVGKTGFNCNCESLVAESPFTATTAFVKVQAISVLLPEQPCSKLPALYSETYFFFEHRGPPATA